MTTNVVLTEKASVATRSGASDCIEIVGARTHNLKNVSLRIPHGSFTVITGVSGSGKSSLAIDTLYAEGQRQYIESLSTYARQFLHQLVRPDVDAIFGLEPTLCIDQRSGTTSPRSTVATLTEVYDYLRLLMARVGTPFCYRCGDPIVQQSREQIVHELRSLPEGTRLVLLSPVVRGRRGTHRDALQRIQQAGLVRVRVDGELYELDQVPPLAVRREHTIEAVVDKIVIRPGCDDRLGGSVDVALDLSAGAVIASYLTPDARQRAGQNHWQERFFNTQYACARCGVSYEEIEPRTFSFNSPYGACPACEGTGEQVRLNPNALIDWEKPPGNGGFVFLQGLEPALRRKLVRQLKRLVELAGTDWKTPLGELPAREKEKLLGSDEDEASVLGMLKPLVDEAAESGTDTHWERFIEALPCRQCGGGRLRPEALAVRVAGKNIHEICQMTVEQAARWIDDLELGEFARAVAAPIVRDLRHRLSFLQQVGVGYLTLERPTRTLSGGELQRVRLAGSIGNGLVGVCYVLDEPSIGLHPVDHQRLIESLRQLQRLGNTIVVVEHDAAMMEAADLLVDLGPGAGRDGGRIVSSGTPDEVRKDRHSLTAAYLRGERSVDRPTPRRSPSKGKSIRLRGATLHNLQNIDLEIPLGLLVGITGVSGSGKSSLIVQTLVPALRAALGMASGRGGPYRQLLGAGQIDKLVEIDQAPIGRTPRSTPATYVGVFDLIRQVFANTRDAKSRGYTASHFSFNTGHGRCQQCQGQGQEKIEMNFLPDIYVTCPACNGRRFDRATLQVKYREKSIADCLEMTVDEAAEFFENFDKIQRLIHAMQQVGLGYISLGQPSSTLSGGEAQRIKLATELARRSTGRTIYFLDEPTTGLHFDDVRRLIAVLDQLVEAGNTVVIIEHNLDVIRNCDWIIDLGPGGGDAGGRIVASGPPEAICHVPESVTGRFLKV